MVRKTIRLIRASIEPPSRNIFRMTLDACVWIRAWSGAMAGVCCSVVGSLDGAGFDHEAEVAIPALSRAAAIFCCWLISELRVAPGLVVRRMICWDAAADCTGGAWATGRASVIGEWASCDELWALRLSRSPNRTTINPAQLPIVQSRRTPARLSAPRAAAAEVMEDWQGTAGIGSLLSS